MALIKVDNLSRSFSYYKKETGLKGSIRNMFKREKLVKEAVKNISFQIDEGEIVGFLGPNGAGKTTTLKMLSGILYPTSGSATIGAYIPWERKKAFKKNFSIIMGQKNQLWWDLPANESLYLNKCIYEINDKDYKEIINELADLMDVKDKLKVQVRRLSLGERMKMEIMAALIHKPKILFLDEPTIGLDIISQKKIREFLKRYNEAYKTTIILTSHYMNDIEDLCKRAIIINQGNITFDGQLSTVNDVFGSKKMIKLLLSESVDRASLEQYGDIKEYDGYKVIIEVDKEHMKAHSKYILDRLPVIDFNMEDIPIEEGIRLLYHHGDTLEKGKEGV